MSAACTSADVFLGHVALHGRHLGGTTTRLLHLLDQVGPDALEAALAEAIRRGAFAAHSVAHLLEQARRGRHAPVPIPVVLPSDPRVRGLVVTPRVLGSYDALAHIDPKGEGDHHE